MMERMDEPFISLREESFWPEIIAREEVLRQK